jgi:hypothetical protein
MHASIQATLYNAHFETHGVPYIAEDLLGKGDRAERLKAHKQGKLALFRFSSLVTGQKMNDEMPEFIAELAANSKKTVH